MDLKILYKKCIEYFITTFRKMKASAKNTAKRFKFSNFPAKSTKFELATLESFKKFFLLLLFKHFHANVDFKI
jgi:hypothetical protein